MTKLDLDELERKAVAATQDEWQWRPGDSGVLEGKNDGQVVLWAPDSNEDTDDPALIVSTSDAAYIAAASPPITLALIARIRELEAALRRTLTGYARQHGGAPRERHRAANSRRR